MVIITIQESKKHIFIFCGASLLCYTSIQILALRMGQVINNFAKNHIKNFLLIVLTFEIRRDGLALYILHMANLQNVSKSAHQNRLVKELSIHPSLSFHIFFGNVSENK